MPWVVRYEPGRTIRPSPERVDKAIRGCVGQQVFTAWLTIIWLDTSKSKTRCTLPRLLRWGPMSTSEACSRDSCVWSASSTPYIKRSRIARLRSAHGYRRADDGAAGSAVCAERPRLIAEVLPIDHLRVFASWLKQRHRGMYKSRSGKTGSRWCWELSRLRLPPAAGAGN